jgi:hypothetical protein
MAIWKGTPYTDKPIASQLGKGLNSAVTPLRIAEDELTDNSNISSSSYPAVATRLGLTAFMDFSSQVWGIGTRNNEYLHFVDGKTWGYITSSTTVVNVTTSLTTSASVGQRALGEFAEFATEDTLYTIWASTLDHLAWDGTTALPVDMTTDCPFTNIIATHKNRIFMAKDKTLYFSALSKTTDWTTVDDAGNIPIVNARGNITGIQEFADHVMVFTNNGIYELFGDGPENFVLADLSNEIGCIARRTIKEVNGQLYWLDYNGVYTYDGNSLPILTGHKAKAWLDSEGSTSLFTNACAGVFRNKYHIAVIDFSDIGAGFIANGMTLVYDTMTQSWNKYDNGSDGLTQYATKDENFYSVTGEGIISSIEVGTLDNSSSIVWTAITKMFEGPGLQRVKAVHSIDLSYEYKGSTNTDSLSLSYSTVNPSEDWRHKSSNFNLLKTFSTALSSLSTGLNTARIFIPTTALSNVSYYRLKISGKGLFIVHELTRNERVKKETF